MFVGNEKKGGNLDRLEKSTSVQMLQNDKTFCLHCKYEPPDKKSSKYSKLYVRIHYVYLYTI